jgi:sugar O-acyltransferase (sialic acid O-acetyltransferase NeuD family)
MRSIYILGASGFASEVTEYMKDDNEFDILGYFDENDHSYNEYCYEAPFLGQEKNFDFQEGSNAIITVSNIKIRKNIYNFLKSKKVDLPTIIHNSSFVGKSCNIGESGIICPYVSITSNVNVGKNFHANIYSYVAHGCNIGDNVTFAPSVKCNGNVDIEDDVYVGTGVIIHQGKSKRPIRIGKGSIIAAGAVVTKNVPAGITVFGNPAIEFNKENIKKRLG